MQLDELLEEVCRIRETGARPRVHGNGFIQLDLSSRRRLNVWGDSRIPRQVIPSQIHDHTFPFKSQVYLGQIVHREFDIFLDSVGAYEKYRPTVNNDEDTRLIKEEGRFRASITRERLLQAGDTYTFQAYRFHETVAPWLCVTVIDKGSFTIAGGPSSTVLVPYGLEPDNTFNRYQESPDKLWTIILEALRGSN